MSQPKHKVMPKGKTSLTYKAGHTGVSNQNVNQKQEPVEWKKGPKVDQLDILVDVQEEYHGEICYQVAYLPSEIDGLTSYELHDKAYNNFQYGYGYKLAKVALFSIRCFPRFGGAFVKITSCPAELVRTGKLITFGKLFSHTISCLPKVDYRANRMDLAYDFDMSGQELVWYSTRAKKGFVYPGSTWGTSYLGSNRSNLQIRIYDKATQLKKVKGVEIAQGQMMRLELILRRAYLPADFPIGLTAMKNPLHGIRPYSRLAVINWLKKHGYADLVADFLQDGLQKALAQLPPKERKAIVAALDKFAVPKWWNPNQVWCALIEHALKHPVMEILKGGKPKAS